MPDMEPAPFPADEEQRLAELEKLDLLYAPPEEAFDRITRRLAEVFDVPISTMSLFDRERGVLDRRVLADADESIRKFFGSGVTELKEKLGPVNWQFMATKKFDARDFEAFLELLPKKADGIAIRHAVEVRHGSFKDKAFIALCRKHGVAIVFAADGEFPLIADVTADFVYARIMGTSKKHKLGYPAPMLKTWGQRARDWERGNSPKASMLLAPAASRKKRDVFLFVISGAKERNPAAAQGIIAGLKR